MSDPLDRNARRRRPAPVEPTPAVAEPAAGPAPLPRRAEAPAPRVSTDLEGLQQIADMDRSEIAAMLDAFTPTRKGGGVREGQRVKGTISRLTPTLAFVAIGGKGDASIDRVELEATVAEGDPIEAYVVSMRDGEIRLARSIGGDATRSLLDEAVEGKIPVQGRVVSRNEHGFEVHLSGNVRAFCPISQMERNPVEEELDAWVGRTLSFRVIDNRGREPIVSHRAIAEAEAREAADKALLSMKEGEILDGTVTTIREFGAFVKLQNGVEGLVRLPNLARKRVTDPKAAVQEGQAVRVRVLGVDTARKRLDLGIRQVEEGDAPAAAAERGPATTGGSFGTLGALLGAVKVPTRRK